ncbi:MAG: hypothetical protein IBJ17_07850 [Reyranella sp.]|jgi:hypothetical protein|nr:hypothetical protein [Reyranella sp.]
MPELRQAVASDAAAVRAPTRAAYAKWVPVMGCEEESELGVSVYMSKPLGL